MWMCDSCEEINDDSVGVCSRCGKAREANRSAPVLDTNVGIDTVSQASGYGIPGGTSGMPRVPSPSYWDDARVLISKQPACAVCLGIIFIGALIPALMYGLPSLFIGMFGAILLGDFVLRIWKISYLGARGVPTFGTLIRRQVYYARNRLVRGTVQYLVNGIGFQITDSNGRAARTYPQEGDPVPVKYDPSSPRFAKLDIPLSVLADRLFSSCLLGIFLYGLASLLRGKPH
jgi:hypothetical protein